MPVQKVMSQRYIYGLCTRCTRANVFSAMGHQRKQLKVLEIPKNILVNGYHFKVQRFVL